MRATSSLALLFVLAGGPAWADRRELYVLVEGGVGAHFLNDAPTATQPGVGVGPAGELQLFYGLTNSLHIGGWVRGFYAPDVAFQGVTPILADGSNPTGVLYENAFGFGAGALVRWRFDVGFAIAPFAQLELGFAWTRFTAQQLIPNGKDFGIDLPLRDQVAPDGRLVVGLEYRLIDLLIIELRLGGRRAISSVSQWQLDASIAVGVVL